MKAENSRFRRSKVGSQNSNTRTFIMSEGLAGEQVTLCFLALLNKVYLGVNCIFAARKLIRVKAVMPLYVLYIK